MKKRIVTSSLVVATLLVGVLLWWGLYPDKYDPKNIHYVLWKWHLASIDLDRAVSVMHHDRWSERMIIGKSEKSLTARFGYLLPPEAVAPCYRAESQGNVPNGDKVLFLRKSDYMIVFHDGVAARVVLLNDVGPC
jgi:hypothetical protein